MYARLSASAALGTYNSLNVGLSSTGALPATVATTASGNVVVATPYWAVAAGGNWGASAAAGWASAASRGRPHSRAVATTRRAKRWRFI